MILVSFVHTLLKLIEEKKRQTFNDEVLWLKYRNLLIRAIAAAHYCNYGKGEGTQSGHAPMYTNGSETFNPIDILNDLVSNLRQYIDNVNCSKFADSFVSILT